MLKKLLNKARIFNNGNKNQNIVNSPGAMILNRSFGEELQYLVRKGQYDEVAALIKQSINGASAQHPAYPHWRYDIKLNNGQVSIAHVPNSPNAIHTHPFRSQMKLILPNDFRARFKNWNEALQYSYEKQITFEFDAKSIETWIGDKAIEKYESEDGTKQIRVSIEPQEFPPPTPMRLYLFEGSLSYDYLIMGLKEIDGNWLILDNSTQKNPQINITVSMNPTTNEAKMLIDLCSDNSLSAKSQLHYCSFMQSMKTSSFALKSLEHNVDIMVAKSGQLMKMKKNWPLVFP